MSFFVRSFSLGDRFASFDWPSRCEIALSEASYVIAECGLRSRFMVALNWCWPRLSSLSKAVRSPSTKRVSVLLRILRSTDFRPANSKQVTDDYLSWFLIIQAIPSPTCSKVPAIAASTTEGSTAVRGTNGLDGVSPHVTVVRHASRRDVDAAGLRLQDRIVVLTL